MSLANKRMYHVIHESPLLATAARIGDAGAVHAVMHARITSWWPSIDAIVEALRPDAPNEPTTAHNLFELERTASELSPYILRVTPRGGEGEMPTTDKLDLRLSEDWVHSMAQACPAFTAVQDAVRDACLLTGGENTFWHLILTYPGSQRQPTHMDNGDDENMFNDFED